MACWLCLLRLMSSWKRSSILPSCIISSIVNIILKNRFLPMHFGHSLRSKYSFLLISMKMLQCPCQEVPTHPQQNNYIHHKDMNFSEFALKPNKNILRHISHHHSPLAKEPLPHDFPLRASEPKNKPNFIKINKNKLPNDFFQKKQSKRVSQQKIYLPQQSTEPLLHTRRIESERLIYSPEKTSFFGFLEEKGQELPLKGISQPSKVLSRKFQTRQEPKRDAFLVEISRKVTGTSKTSKRDLLQLFPPTFDDRMNDMIAESSRGHIQRITPKKESALGQKGTQLFVNPEKTESNNEFKFPSARKTKELTIKLANMSFLEHQNGEGMNVTFYNAKSNCLPPINRQAS